MYSILPLGVCHMLRRSMNLIEFVELSSETRNDYVLLFDSMIPQMCFVKHDPERKLKMIVIKLVWGCLSVKYSKPCEGGPHLPFIYTI